MDTTDISLDMVVEEEMQEQEDDVIQSAARDRWTYFDRTPEFFPWTPSSRDKIENRRAKLSDCLLFDTLLRLGNIADPASLYPPADTQALRQLVNAIHNCTWDSLKQDCLFYYLLRFYDDDRASDYVVDKVVPPQFVGLAAAYWCLDNAVDIPRAISYLSDARVQRNDVTKIMEALCLEPDANRLIRQYVRTVRPHLMAPKDINIYLIALAESSLWEAWQYQRSFLQQSEIRDNLIRKILQWLLSPQPRPLALTQLLSFPLNSFEDAILHSFALKPPSSIPAVSIPILQDLVCVRLVRVGDYAEAIKFDRQFTLGAGEDDTARKIARERRRMLDEITELMPEIERQLLEEELENLSLGGKGKSASGRLSLSWNPDRPPATQVQSESARKTKLTSSKILPSQLGRNDNLFVQVPKQPERTIFDGIKSYTAKPPVILPRAGPQTAGSSAATSKYQNGFLGLGKPSSQMVLPGNSLFNKTGSANTTPNAFYDPSRKQPLLPARLTDRRVSSTPPVLIDTERPPTPPALAISEAERARAEGGEDVSMKDAPAPPEQSKEQPVPAPEQPQVTAAPSVQEDMPTNEFGASVFGANHPAPAPSAPETAAFRSRQAQADRSLSESQRKVPGAFDPNESIDTPSPSPGPEPEQQFFSSAYNNASAAAMFNRHHSPTPSPPDSPTPAPSKRTRTHDHNPAPAKKIKEADPILKRSLPGAFMPEEDEEDEVPPLPASPKKLSRKGAGRTSRASSVLSDEDDSGFRPRRSSRLSTASSVGSLGSPEAPRQTRSGRTTTTTLPAPKPRRKR